MTLYHLLSADGSAFDLPITPFTFLSNNSEACLDIRVINDTTAQGNRSVSLGVKSQDSQFLVNGDVTNITFLDEQGNIMYLLTDLYYLYLAMKTKNISLLLSNLIP